jgi:hypothetical protein
MSAVLNFITFIKLSLNKKLYTSAIFVDISKAFIWLCITCNFLDKLYKSGVWGDFYELLRDYLSPQCRQFVQIQDDRSDAQFIRHGVPAAFKCRWSTIYENWMTGSITTNWRWTLIRPVTWFLGFLIKWLRIQEIYFLVNENKIPGCDDKL